MFSYILRHNTSNQRTHFLLREDILHLEEITAQTRLLCKHRIENKEQLLSHQSGIEQEMTSLYGSRKSLYNRIRRCKDEDKIAAYKE